MILEVNKEKTTVLRFCPLAGCLFCLHELSSKSHEGFFNIRKQSLKHVGIIFPSFHQPPYKVGPKSSDK